ncbi:PREDICTED: lethal(3)malignant brain tumor-like protein 4 [Galeopterus variegatus]|uniref:Lethal(3)malignant brain tumor-like protein 4 n=1 Tax=Galeopterus variegatus TaxID=482537 RepID=A0ABM0R3C4_GALVR|nr:PREDICTED: lethal(3)malignant brain tumor-like protein 4 [Galeopterus variegatus]
MVPLPSSALQEDPVTLLLLCSVFPQSSSQSWTATYAGAPGRLWPGVALLSSISPSHAISAPHNGFRAGSFRKERRGKGEDREEEGARYGPEEGKQKQPRRAELAEGTEAAWRRARVWARPGRSAPPPRGLTTSRVLMRLEAFRFTLSQGTAAVSSVAAQEAWSWEQYLKEQKAIAAPVELFSKDQSFPEHENGFQIGMRLEGIDPRHPSVFCVLSVAEVCGYRLRLHFDGYLSCYDFWTNAGSPDIHPVGWCEKTKHELHIPKGYRKDKFVWMDYLKACKLQNAPKKLFINRSSNGPMPKEFQVGMKLEAVDRKNPSLVCVATIADIVEDRLLVHFDNWDDCYDYWCDVNSPYVQPVGWCQENGRTLIAPQGYPDPENFSWTEYLEATQTNAVPAKVFKMRLPHGFLPNMKLEVVDKRNPRLIRVATIIDVDDQRVKSLTIRPNHWLRPMNQSIIGHLLTSPSRQSAQPSALPEVLPTEKICPSPPSFRDVPEKGRSAAAVHFRVVPAYRAEPAVNQALALSSSVS